MSNPWTYTDHAGDQLKIGRTMGGDRLVVAAVAGGTSVPVEIEMADVRGVTAEMRAVAGLPSRWTSLRERIADEIATYNDAIGGYLSARDGAAAAIVDAKREGARAVLRCMDEIEAEQR